jgi:hypothetical protein
MCRRVHDASCGLIQNSATRVSAVKVSDMSAIRTKNTGPFCRDSARQPVQEPWTTGGGLAFAGWVRCTMFLIQHYLTMQLYARTFSCCVFVGALRSNFRWTRGRGGNVRRQCPVPRPVRRGGKACSNGKTIAGGAQPLHIKRRAMSRSSRRDSCNAP